jgi:hypothetical protein
MKKAFIAYAYFGWLFFYFCATTGIKALYGIAFHSNHIASFDKRGLLWPLIIAVLMWAVQIANGYLPNLIKHGLVSKRE